MERRELLVKAGTGSVGAALAGTVFWPPRRAAAQAGFALDSEVVHRTGDEVISGVKTFATDPVFPTRFIPISQVQGGSANNPATTALFTLQPSDAQRAPFTLVVSGTTFNGVLDTVMSFGYNIGPGGSLLRAEEPSMILQIETNYAPNSSVRSLECFLQYQAPNNAYTIRPLFVQIDRQATTPADAIMALAIQGPLTLLTADAEPMVNFLPNTIHLRAPQSGSNSSINVQAPPSRTASLLLGHNGKDGVMAMHPYTADIGTLVIGGVPAMVTLAKLRGAASSGGISVGGISQDAVATFLVGSSSAEVKGVVARGRSGQLGSLFEVQDVTGKTLSRFDRGGYFMTRKASPPADSDLVAGELAVWVDPTVGSSKLMIKVKQTNGVVRVGHVDITDVADAT